MKTRNTKSDIRNKLEKQNPARVQTFMRVGAIPTFVVWALAASAAEPEAGFKPIFDGKDLAGWDGDPKLWSVKGGAIVGETTADNPLKHNTFLIWTNGQVDDFELRCSFRITANNDKGFANSGIQYRSKVIDPAGWVVGGYQADMEAGPTYTGILYEEKMPRQIMAARGEKVTWDASCAKKVTGSLGKSEELQAAIKKGDWNDYVIIARGNHLQHFINGKQTIDVTDECEAQRAMRGVLALQLHQGQPMKVEFRDVRLKVLSGNDRSAAEELKKLQGSWRVTALEAEGERITAEAVTNLYVTIKDNTYELLNLDNENSGTFQIDPSKTPAQMEIHCTTGADSGQTWPGIYEVNGDDFRVCYARRGKKRPTTFSGIDNPSLMMITYKRKQS
jgi:uncharacterized protein (TIGR03067 family)